MADVRTERVAWADNLRHDPRPNEVKVPLHAVARELPPARPGVSRVPAAAGHRPSAEASYYDIPMLQQPVWKWEISSYFFLGGLSAGAYILSRLAERIGAEQYRELIRAATYVSLFSFLPGPPLLIHDLGDPKRFHHMLRVWKPSTPMNLGTWSIVAYSGMATAAALREYFRGAVRSRERSALRHIHNPTLLALHDLAGVPFAVMVAGYSGVLLSCTSNPVWCKNPWLGPLFSASSIATGAEAVSLTLDLAGTESPAASRALMKIDTLAHLAEAGASAGFSKAAGEKARPLHHGAMRRYQQISRSAIVFAEVLKLLPVRGKARKWVRMVSAALGLVGGFALRWTMVQAGHQAAADPDLARLNSRASNPEKAPRHAPPAEAPTVPERQPIYASGRQ